MLDEESMAKIKKAIAQGQTDKLREQIQQNLNKLRKVYSDQLNSARVAIEEMELAKEELKLVKDSLDTVEKATREVSMLVTQLKPIRDECSRHSQLSTTKENFKHIFDVPLNVSTTRANIAEGKLLMAHKYLQDLENSRYALLYELHKSPSSNQNDKITIKQYFSDVDKLSEELGKQIWMIVRKTLTCVLRVPQTLVSALRIIEREEKMDEQTSKKFEATGFMPPGRPKQWRKRVFDILEEAIAERISGSRFDERGNEHWTVMQLNVTRLMMLEDLRIINLACVQCFPPSYNIADAMLKIYHKCLRSHLLDLSHHLDVKDENEYVRLLNWVQEYTGPNLLSHPELNIDAKKVGLDPLLPDSTVQELQDKYFAKIEKNYREWMSNTINQEERDWSSTKLPDSDDGHYHTSTPVFIFQMIQSYLKAAEKVNQILKDRILALSMDQLTVFAQQYRDTIEKYCKIHFSDRGRYKFFTPYMVAITNNCSRIEQLFLKMERSGPAVKAFKALRDEAIDKLLDELFLDVGKEINQIGNQDWMDGKVSCVENICLTLDDYFEDYKHLRRDNYRVLLTKLAYRLARDYTRAILMKKINLSTQRQRQLFSEKFYREGERLEGKVTPDQMNSDKSPFKPLRAMKEFLQLRDPDLLALEVQNLKRCYPDMNEGHLAALLSMTDIIPRRECLKEAKRMLESVTPQGDPESKTILSEIQLPS